MTNALIALFCAAVWTWALYNNWVNERLKMFYPKMYLLSIFTSGYLVIYYLIYLFTGAHISVFLFILAIAELIILTLSNLLS